MDINSGQDAGAAAAVTDILCNTFAGNKSVLTAMGPRGNQQQKMQNLMRYAHAVARQSGHIYFDAQRQACALVTDPGKPLPLFQRLWLDLRFINQVCGWRGVASLLARNKTIAATRLSVPHHYLWFLGVHPDGQNKGYGTLLLSQVLRAASAESKEVLLETSVPENLRFYERLGFRIYREIDVGYRLYFLTSGCI